MIEIIADMAVQILSNRIKIIDSYKITDKSKMKEIIYAILYIHPEIKFDRDYDLLVSEWVAHNRMYKWGIKKDKTKDVDLEFKERWYNKLIFKIIGI